MRSFEYLNSWGAVEVGTGGGCKCRDDVTDVVSDIGRAKHSNVVWHTIGSTEAVAHTEGVHTKSTVSVFISPSQYHHFGSLGPIRSSGISMRSVEMVSFELWVLF